MTPHRLEGAVKLAPSILAADFARLGEQVVEAERGGADRIHLDVMDGHFVPNLSMGAPIVRSLRRVTRLPLETHLMISDPDSFLDQFAEAGSDSFLVHCEGNHHLHRRVQRIKALGKRAGVVINPATPAAVLEDIDVDNMLDNDRVIADLRAHLEREDHRSSAWPSWNWIAGGRWPDRDLHSRACGRARSTRTDARTCAPPPDR